MLLQMMSGGWKESPYSGSAAKAGLLLRLACKTAFIHALAGKPTDQKCPFIRYSDMSTDHHSLLLLGNQAFDIHIYAGNESSTMSTWRVTCMSALTSRQQEKALPPSTAGGQVYSPCASFRLLMSRSMRSFLATRHPDACRYSFPPLQGRQRYCNGQILIWTHIKMHHPSDTGESCSEDMVCMRL